MLKGIDPLLTGSLLAILSDMGHGEEIVLADANFPARGVARRLVELPGTSIDTVLEAVLGVFPLDTFVDSPAAVMEGSNQARSMHDGLQQQMTRIMGRHIGVEHVERFAFYERARQAYAVVATGERRFYANLILKKDVLQP